MRAAVALYALLIVVFAVYGFVWSDYSFKGAGWILGRAILWPMVVTEYLYELVKAIVTFIVGITLVLGFLWFVMARR